MEILRKPGTRKLHQNPLGRFEIYSGQTYTLAIIATHSTNRGASPSACIGCSKQSFLNGYYLHDSA